MAAKNKKDFKPHMMYPPGGKKADGKMALKFEDHLRLSEMGWGHDVPKKRFGGAIMKSGGQVQGCGCPYGMEMGPNSVL
tara:strand:+ start:79 stop:315 length:237 start_codon:yes stop_codon:yes gene_type:complete